MVKRESLDSYSKAFHDAKENFKVELPNLRAVFPGDCFLIAPVFSVGKLLM